MSKLRLIELQERLITVKAQLDELKNYKTQLDQQYEEAVGQFKNMHGQEVKDILEGFGMIAREEQIEQFHELNKQKAAPLSIDRIMASHEQAVQEAQAAGASPPPPLPPRVEVVDRYQQVREMGWEVALVALMVGVYKNNPYPGRPEGNRLLSKLALAREFEEGSERRTGVYLSVHEDSSTEPTHKFPANVEFRKKSDIRAALELLPLVRELVNGQVGALEKLHQYFEGKRNELGDKIAEVENQREILESEIYKFTASLAPPTTPFFVSGQRQSKDDTNEKATESPTKSSDSDSRPTV